MLPIMAVVVCTTKGDDELKLLSRILFHFCLKIFDEVLNFFLKTLIVLECIDKRKQNKFLSSLNFRVFQCFDFPLLSHLHTQTLFF